mmetsp:Transcript_1152/g.3476  ORF Transcript_1152/g.3476 Transcript_1152/m.3476 type:complete len:122 (+) Transcript_1152:139-504(+)
MSCPQYRSRLQPVVKAHRSNPVARGVARDAVVVALALEAVRASVSAGNVQLVVHRPRRVGRVLVARQLEERRSVERVRQAGVAAGGALHVAPAGHPAAVEGAAVGLDWHGGLPSMRLLGSR